jgi:hypothetical protein
VSTAPARLEVAADGEVSREKATRMAQNQVLFREVNERIHEVAADYGITERFSIFCECASSACQEEIELTETEYEHLRRTPTHFAVLRGHDVPAVEHVVEENDRFVTVEKIDEGAAAALSLAPRSPSRLD